LFKYKEILYVIRKDRSSLAQEISWQCLYVFIFRLYVFMATETME